MKQEDEVSWVQCAKDNFIVSVNSLKVYSVNVLTSEANRIHIRAVLVKSKLLCNYIVPTFQKVHYSTAFSSNAQI